MWTQKYFTEFLSEIGGLFTAIMAAATFTISGYQNFVSNDSMLKKLYGEEDMTQTSEEAGIEAGQQKSPQEIFKAKLEKRQEFTASYFSYTLISCFKALCCCFSQCCKNSRKFDSHRKI